MENYVQKAVKEMEQYFKEHDPKIKLKYLTKDPPSKDSSEYYIDFIKSEENDAICRMLQHFRPKSDSIISFLLFIE
jgi:hypothetical protein